MSLLKKKDPYQVYIMTNFLSQLFFTFIFTVNLLYQVQIVKLDPFQLVFIGFALELSVFLFEIPTGVVADMKSRKLSIIIGYFLIGIGFLLEGLFPYFIAVFLSQIIWGIGYTFTSGAMQAWIADEIGEEQASLAFVKGAKASNFGKVIAIPLSILIGYSMVNLPVIIGGACMIGLAIFLIRFMQEENFRPLKNEERLTLWNSVKGNMSQILSFSKTSFLIRILFLIALFFGLYSEGFDRLWVSHLLKESNLSNGNDGKLVIIMGCIQFVVVLTTFIALNYLSRSKVHKHLNHIYAALFIGSILIIGSLFGFAFSTSMIALIVFYIVIQVSRSVMYPLEDIWLNKIIPDSSTRATFFSVKGQVDAIGQISGGPIIGAVASNFSIKAAIIVSAFILTPVVFLYNLLLKKSKVKEDHKSSVLEENI